MIGEARERRSGLPRALFASVLGVLALGASAKPITGDSIQMCEAAENILEHGAPFVSRAIREDVVRGPHGRYFTKYPLMTIVGCVPTVALEGLGQALGGEDSALARYFKGLGPALTGSLGALGFFILARELGFAESLATIATLLLFFTTPLWHYARSAYSESLQAALCVWTLWAWVRARREPTRKVWLLGGFLLGLAVNAKALLVILVPAVAIDQLFIRRDLRGHMRVAAFAGLGALPGVIAFLWYNHLRFGGVFNMGYSTGRDGVIGFGGPLLTGLYGLLLSSGKSVFLYAPLLLLVGFGIRHMLERKSRDLLLIGVPVVFVFLAVAKWWAWSGDVAWGPRLVVPMIPLLFMPVLWALEHGGRALRALAVGLSIAGLYVALLGVCIRPFQYVSVMQPLVERSLGKVPADVRDDLIPLHFVPELSPIVGHHWLLWRYLRHERWDESSHYPWEGTNVPAWRLTQDPGPAALNFWFARGVHYPLLIGTLLFTVLAMAILVRCLWRARGD